MPVTEETTLHIVCDNTACPGNELPVDDRTGWLFVTSEVYGDPSQSHVFCCKECASAGALAE